MNFATDENLLRGGADVTPSARACLGVGAAGCALAGLGLGAAAGDVRTALFAAIKVPLLIAFVAGLCLPSFFVVNTVLGLRDDFRAACRGLLAAQATLGIALGAQAPMLVFLGASVLDPYLLTLCDAVQFGAATWAAQRVLARHYAPLLARDARHRHALRGWLVLFAFTGVQVAWVLRPFRGTEGFPVQFLRPEAFEQNAYVVLLDHCLRLLR
ncbi:MAG: hypothetical protein FJ265_06950 [Planctomycetes bacterium]|nr:hypothetical protein [Planctomycetota bacterium]